MAKNPNDCKPSPIQRIKIFSALQSLQGAQTLTFTSVTNKQTDKQTKHSTFFAAPVAGEIRASPNFAW